jgi:tetratricopeptide (TPR) repeat protein
MADIFVSYAHIDDEKSSFQKHLISTLEAENLTVWIDKTNLPIGEDWWKQIRKGIASANTFVFVMTDNAWKSRTCMLEVAEAIKNNIRIISVKMIADSDVLAAIQTHQNYIPNDIYVGMLEGRNLFEVARNDWVRLQQLQWSTFVKADESEFQELIAAIKDDFGYSKRHAQLREKAQEWKEHNENSSYLLYGLEVTDAEKWIEASDNAEKLPPPNPLQREYIASSVRNRWITSIRILGALLIIAILIIGIIIVEQNRIVTENLKTAIAASNMHVTGVYDYDLGLFEPARNFFKKAIDQYSIVLQDYPQIAQGNVDTTIYLYRWDNDLGASCAQLSDYPCAEMWFKKAIELHPEVIDPTDLLPYLNLAATYRDDNRQYQLGLDVLDDAVVHTEATRLMLVEGSINRLRGSILFYSGQYYKVIDLLPDTVDILAENDIEEVRKTFSSDLLEMLYYLAASYQFTNDYSHACDYWTQYQMTLLSYPPRRRWIHDELVFSDALSKIHDLKSLYECSGLS